MSCRKSLTSWLVGLEALQEAGDNWLQELGEYGGLPAEK